MLSFTSRAYSQCLWSPDLGFHLLWLREPRKTSIRLRVEKNGTVVVTTAVRVSAEAVLSFVAQHLPWVRGQLHQVEQVQTRYPPKCYRAGEEFPFLGEARKLLYVRSAVRKPRLQFSKGFMICEVPDSIYNTTFLWAPQPAMQDSVLTLYRKEAEKIITERCRIQSERMRLFPRRLIFRNQKTLWGSCTFQGDLNFNLKLAGTPVEVIDYVVAHELAHLKHRNHSKDFWSLVEAHIPDFQQSQKWLKNHHFSFDFLAKESDLYGSKLSI
jgi:predicted metal-dependent hydrolase